MRYLSAHYIFPVSSPPLKNGIVCTDDCGTIVDVIDTGGKLHERERLEFYNGILVPGFVNAHCHLELSHLRGAIPPHGGLPDFLSSVGRIRPADDATVLSAAKAADEEMRRNGIVAVGDISNRADTIPVKRESRLRYRTFIEVFGLDARRAELVFSAARNLELIHLDAGLPASIVPHATYSVSPPLLSLLADYYATNPAIASVHWQESEDETGPYLEGKGALAEVFRRSGLLPDDENCRTDLVEEAEQCLSHARQCLLVHNVFSSREDISRCLRRLKKVFRVLCPGSNLYIQNRLPDFSLFAEADPNVCIGTDSLASNTGLSVLEELKIIQNRVPDIPLSQLLYQATLSGAWALDFDNILGSFEKNKSPGINLIKNIDFERMRLTDQSLIEVLI